MTLWDLLLPGVDVEAAVRSAVLPLRGLGGHVVGDEAGALLPRVVPC